MLKRIRFKYISLLSIMLILLTSALLYATTQINRSSTDEYELVFRNIRVMPLNYVSPTEQKVESFEGSTLEKYGYSGFQVTPVNEILSDDEFLKRLSEKNSGAVFDILNSAKLKVKAVVGDKAIASNGNEVLKKISDLDDKGRIELVNSSDVGYDGSTMEVEAEMERLNPERLDGEEELKYQMRIRTWEIENTGSGNIPAWGEYRGPLRINPGESVVVCNCGPKYNIYSKIDSATKNEIRFMAVVPQRIIIATVSKVK